MCFKGGVKVKRQPWNILSLTSLQLLLCNLHVIVWQRGEKTACQSMLFHNVWYHESSQLVSLIVMLAHRISMTYCCVLCICLNQSTDATRTCSVSSQCDWSLMILVWKEKPITFTCLKAVHWNSFHSICHAPKSYQQAFTTSPSSLPDSLESSELLHQMTVYVAVCLGGHIHETFFFN